MQSLAYTMLETVEVWVMYLGKCSYVQYAYLLFLSTDFKSLEKLITIVIRVTWMGN